MLGGAISRVRTARLARRMRRDWDRRARLNAMHFVNTGQADWDKDSFFKTGEENVRDQILSDLECVCQGRDPRSMRVLEIGCGVGRMTRALASHFGEVHGVDVSEEMVRLAKEHLSSTPNAHVHLNSGTDLRVLDPLRFDFAFSFIVFQHIPSRAVIDGYIGEVGRVLRPGSMFKFQVQGYRGEALRESSRNTWLGASVSERNADAMARRHGFELVQSVGAGTQYYWLWYRKSK